MTSDLTEDRARSIAGIALNQSGLSSDDLRLIRMGTNAVFIAGETVVRVAARDYNREDLATQIQLSRWLIDEHYPTAHLIGALEVSRHPVSLWTAIHASRPPTMTDLGNLARRFHSVTDGYPGQLPGWEPLGRLGRRLDRLTPDQLITQADCTVLHERKESLVSRARKLTYELHTGPIHGDLHTGNVLVDRQGPKLIDFDRIALGPREWDLADPLAGVRLFGRPPEAWDDFVESYGYDFTTFPGADLLVELRALFMFSWLLTLPRSNAVAEEIPKRLRFFKYPEREVLPWSPI